ncbi:hypothetical protein Tco_0661236 [Tanacetum coccineum]
MRLLISNTGVKRFSNPSINQRPSDGNAMLPRIILTSKHLYNGFPATSSIISVFCYQHSATSASKCLTLLLNSIQDSAGTGISMEQVRYGCSFSLGLSLDLILSLSRSLRLGLSPSTQTQNAGGGG